MLQCSNSKNKTGSTTGKPLGCRSYHLQLLFYNTGRLWDLAMYTVNPGGRSTHCSLSLGQAIHMVQFWGSQRRLDLTLTTWWMMEESTRWSRVGNNTGGKQRRKALIGVESSHQNLYYHPALSTALCPLFIFPWFAVAYIPCEYQSHTVSLTKLNSKPQFGLRHTPTLNPAGSSNSLLGTSKRNLFKILYYHFLFRLQGETNRFKVPGPS